MVILNRRALSFLGVVLSVAVFAVTPWHTSAQIISSDGVRDGNQDQKEDRNAGGQGNGKARAAADNSPEVHVVEIPGRVGDPGLPSGTLRSEAILASQGFVGEVEPNGTSGTATPLGGTNVVVRANIVPNADVDFFSFSAAGGDRIYAAIMTSFSSNGSTDSQLRLFQPDGTTLIEVDYRNGSQGSLSSTLAGVPIPGAGTYFLEVRKSGGQLRPYELHFRLQSGAPTPEVEGNDTAATANPLPVNGWVSGSRDPAAATEQDWYSLALNAGDTVYLSLDLDPERDLVTWNGRLGFALFGDASNQVLVVDDAGASEAPDPTIPSEAMFFTVRTAGTYYAVVDSATAEIGGPTATYHLSVSVHPATNEGINCTTYTSTDVPKTIAGVGLVSSTITVPGHPRIADLDVDIVLNHAYMADVNAHLRSPAGNDNALFTGIGSITPGVDVQMSTTFDDEAGTPPAFTSLNNVQTKPELAYRLGWFDGEDAGGTWTLDLRDVFAEDSGTLTAWSIRICEAPPPPVCAPGFAPVTVFSTDFEAGAAGFTHSGTADEWELGLPATVATNPVAGFTTCNSGGNCWKTDLDSTYNASSNQDLLSPNINLFGLSAPVVVTWAQRYQMENANWDHMFVDYQQAGGATPVRLFEWLDATMTDLNIGESAGWSLYSRRADSLAGLNTELRFHLDSDNTINFGGLAVDDVTVTACTLAAVRAEMTSPVPGTTLPGTSATFTWTTGIGATDYWLYVGTTGVGSIDILTQDQETATSRLVTGFPAAGGTVYVRLWTLLPGGWQFNDYTYFRYADDPLQAGVTQVKAAHITDLRQRIDAQRVRFKLLAYVWTDPAITVGTDIRAVHITELRTALAEAYTAGRILPLPTYTDPGLAAGTQISAAHITQLRAAVVAIE